MPTESKPPVRGTQTFVGVMSAVWGRPSLAGLEIAWRWLPGIVVAVCIPFGGVWLGSHGMAIRLGPQLTGDLAAVQAATVFQPVAAVHTVLVAWNDLLTRLWPVLRWLLPTLFLAWNVLAAFGRTWVLRRFDPTLAARQGTVFVLGMLRSLLLAGAWFAWLRFVAWAVRITITGPAANRQEPNIVALAALWICGTLLLYVAWGVFSWFLYLAPLVAMRRDLGALAALTTALRAGSVRGKLIEINLVMHIVKLALIVLAMVLSASPLAFSTVATQTFYAAWWTVAVLLYFAASDYFHVVRSAAYLRLWRAYDA